MGVSCTNSNEHDQGDYPAGSFGYDHHFLKEYDPELAVLSSDDSTSQVAVSARYQGKVFTSTAAGAEGRSFGWVNYKAFGGAADEHMNAYGGENRLWLGPEGAQFSLFFKPGTAMEFADWHTPAAFDTEPWTIIEQDRRSVSLNKTASLTNYAGTTFDLKINRIVRLLTNGEVAGLLSVPTPADLKIVAYTTLNTLTNSGAKEWTPVSGAPCIWILDMFVPSPEVVTVIPYREEGAGKVATTDYFGAIPPDRVRYDQGILYFRADGKSRGKLGLSPQRAKPIAGSYDGKNKVLTLTLFDVDDKASYLNHEWKLVDDPYNGDAVNAYNDGPLEDGSQMGPFYELESVSPAAFLKPGESLLHRHTVIHLTGNTESLDKISRETLGVSLEKIQSAFNK